MTIDEPFEEYISQPSITRFLHFSVRVELGSHSVKTQCLLGLEKLQPIILSALGFKA